MPRRLDLGTAVNRMMTDGAISRPELKRLSKLANARSSSDNVIGALDGFEDKMSPQVRDIYDAYKEAATAPPPAGGATYRPIDILSGAADVEPALPEWYPGSWDLDGAAAAARGIIEAQGEKPESIGPGKCREVVFTDADHTIIKSSTPVYMVHKRTGEHMRHPETGRLLMLGVKGAGYKEELASLKESYPEAGWGDYKKDFRDFGSIAEVMRTPEIGETIDRLERSDRDRGSRDFIITARHLASSVPALDEYLAARDVDINGVFPVNNGTIAKKMGYSRLRVTSPQRKALVMASLLKLYDPDSANVRKVTYLEDKDENLVAAMELLPKLFPDVRFEFKDVVHRGDERFEQELVARTGRSGELKDGAGRVLTTEELGSYASVDAPRGPDPAFVDPEE